MDELQIYRADDDVVRERAPKGAEATGRYEGVEKRTTASETLETGVTDQQARLHQPERERERKREREGMTRGRREEQRWKKCHGKKQEAVVIFIRS